MRNQTKPLTTKQERESTLIALVIFAIIILSFGIITSSQGATPDNATKLQTSVNCKAENKKHGNNKQTAAFYKYCRNKTFSPDSLCHLHKGILYLKDSVKVCKPNYNAMKGGESK